ncbi:hypothetical protein [Deinococcus navajonensis]|uniref:GAF domain-containing protein n=1 Tax=Deinococcus navajonensis TaxID=309884 RepID=A0ABV8XL43_9DEIO
MSGTGGALTTQPIQGCLGAIWLWLLRIVVPLSLLIPLALPGYELYLKPNAERADWIKFALGAFGTLIAGLVYWSNRKNEINHLSGLAEGQKKTAKHWEVSSRALLGATGHLSDAMAKPRSQRVPDGKNVSREAILGVLKVVAAVFKNVEENELTVTLGMPTKNGLGMRIVFLTPPSATRQHGGYYPFPPAGQELHSMLRALQQGTPVYTRDCHDIAGMETKLYRSILSFPVRDQTGQIVAVVNVDGQRCGMFDNSEHDGPNQGAVILANELAQPALRLIVFALEHCAPFDADLR